MRARFLADASVYLCANCANAAVPFLLLPLLTRVLPPADYGRVAVFQAVVSLLVTFVGLNAHGSVSVQFFKSGSGVLATFLPAVLTLFAGSVVLAGTLAVVAAGPSSAWTGLDRGWLLAAVAVAAAQFAVTLRLLVWQLRRQPVPYGLFQVGLSLSNMLLSVALVVGGDRGAEGRIEGILIATVVFAAAGLVGLQWRETLRWRWDVPSMQTALRFGLPLLPHAVGSAMVLLADRFIITRQIGSGATGSYFVAVQFALPLALIGDSFNRAFVPWLYGRLAAGKKLEAVTASYVTTLVFVLVGLGYATVVYAGFDLLVGPHYQAMRKVVLILIGGGVLQAVYYAFVNYIFYSERTELLSAITVLSGGLYALVGWYACGRFGTEALAWCFTATQAMILFATALVAMKVVTLPWLAIPAMAGTVRDWLLAIGKKGSVQ